MRAKSVMRFVLFGAVGFGIGWAVAGLFNVALVGITEPMFQRNPPGWVPLALYSAYFLAGACGGAGLGLAIGGWKRVVALTVAGGLGFGVSFFLFFLVVFLFGLGQTGFAMGVGLFEGTMLGLMFGDWKRVVALALAGMVGFGICGAIVTALRMPFALYPFFDEFAEFGFIELWQAPLLLLGHMLAQVVVGLIGGASLGAALGYLEKRKRVQERSPRVR